MRSFVAAQNWGERRQRAGTDGDVQPRLEQVDADETAPGKRVALVVMVTTGSMIQVSAYCAGYAKRGTAHPQGGARGDSVKQVGRVMVVPIGIKGKDGTMTYPDQGTRHVCVMLLGEKPGKTTVTITPVGVDGKERPVRRFTVDVFTPSPNSDFKSRK